MNVKCANVIIKAAAMLSLTFGMIAQAQSEPMPLDRFLELVQRESPDFDANKATVEAARARSVGIRIPPPMVGFMRMSEANSNSTGIEISQEIPFPTKIIQEKKARQLESEAKTSAVISANAVILADAKFAFVSYWAAQERLKILREKLAWLRRHSRLAKTAARYDSESQIYMLNIESQADTIENEVLAAEAEIAEQRSQLKIFAPSLMFTEVEVQDPEIIDPSSALKESPMVQAREKEVRALETMKNLSKSSYLPDFYIRYRGFESNGMIPSSQEGMIGISLPFVFFWQPQAEIAEATSNQKAAEAALRKARVASTEQANGLLQRANAIYAQISNLRKKLIPNSERRIRLIRNVSQRTLAGLEQHNEVVLSGLDLSLSAITLRLEHERIMLKVTSLTGR